MGGNIPSSRPFFYLNKAQLQKHPLYKRVRGLNAGSKVEEIRAAFVDAHAALSRGESLTGDNGIDEGGLDPILLCLLRKSFLKKKRHKTSMMLG